MNYREHLTKNECLLNAILWTVLPVLHLVLFLYRDIISYLNSGGTWYAILLLVLELIALTVHWYRYFAYDKKEPN